MLGELLELIRNYRRIPHKALIAVALLSLLALSKAIYCDGCELSLVTIVLGAHNSSHESRAHPGLSTDKPKTEANKRTWQA